MTSLMRLSSSDDQPRDSTRSTSPSSTSHSSARDRRQSIFDHVISATKLIINNIGVGEKEEKEKREREKEDRRKRRKKKKKKIYYAPPSQ